jgi:hypothetical protein
LPLSYAGWFYFQLKKGKALMSKKHFIKIAAALKSAVDNRADARQVACDIATVLATTNPRFNRSRFLSACGVQ